jgi:hypothetical protein
MHVEPVADPNPLSAGFFKACDEMGHQLLEDCGAPVQDGVCPAWRGALTRGARTNSTPARWICGWAADHAIKLTERFAACFHDARRPHLIEHEVATLLGQRVFGIALGYEDLNDHDELRHDPVMAVLAGKLEARRKECALTSRVICSAFARTSPADRPKNPATCSTDNIRRRSVFSKKKRSALSHRSFRVVMI